MSEHNDRRLSVLLWIGVATMVIIIIVALISVPSILTGASNSEEVRRGTDLTSCRAQFAAKVTDAQAALIEAKAKLDVNTNEALRAATVDRDQERLSELVAEAPQLEAAVTSAIDASTVARDEYRAAIQHAIDDPDGFVRDCRKGQS